LLDPVAKALALRKAPLFSSLAADAILPVANLCSELELDEGEQLFAAGEPGDSLYVVVRGEVRVESGDDTLATLGAGECVGEMAALDFEPRSATVVAATPSHLIRLDRNDLLDLLRDRPALVDGLARVLAERLRRTQ
jgi:CRP-like cAMP-binding protein